MSDPFAIATDSIFSSTVAVPGILKDTLRQPIQCEMYSSI